MMRKIDEIKNKMVSFTCHKTVKAVPMNRKDYNDLRGWSVPSDENPEDEGYLVEYQDESHKNLDGFEGYVSWSPKDVFEKGYRLSETFTDRLKNEMEDLEVKIQKLENFLYDNASEGLDTRLRGLLIVQLSAMKTYYSTVRTRFESLTQYEEN